MGALALSTHCGMDRAAMAHVVFFFAILIALAGGSTALAKSDCESAADAPWSDVFRAGKGFVRFHVRGFLGPKFGAKLHQALEALHPNS